MGKNPGFVTLRAARGPETAKLKDKTPEIFLEKKGRGGLTKGSRAKNHRRAPEQNGKV